MPMFKQGGNVKGSYRNKNVPSILKRITMCHMITKLKLYVQFKTEVHDLVKSLEADEHSFEVRC